MVASRIASRGRYHARRTPASAEPPGSAALLSHPCSISLRPACSLSYASKGPDPGAAAREPRAHGAANRPHCAGKPSPGLRGGGIQCCVRVQVARPEQVPVSESVPVPGPPTLVQRTARWLLALAGWSVDLPWPPEPRGIIVVYPHTSNWDFVVGLLALLASGLPAQWVGKDTLFRWPFGRLLRCLGGIPVNRREHTRFIEQLPAEFRHRSWMWRTPAR